MIDILESIGNVPVTTSVLASLYPDIKNITPKLTNLERSGQLIHLKSGLYVASPEASRVAFFFNCYTRTRLVWNADDLKIWSNDYFLQLADRIRWTE